MLGRRTSATDSGLWVPTPIRNDAEKRGDFDHIRSWGLAGFVKLWPTPVASDTSSRSKPYAQGGSHSRAAAMKRGQSSAELNGGSLNPTWVEWLMGWPLGWTDLEPLATDKYLNAPLKRGAC